MNFYFLVCSALLSSVYQDRHIHRDTTKMKQETHIPTTIEHQAEKFEKLYLCFYTGIPHI